MLYGTQGSIQYAIDNTHSAKRNDLASGAAPQGLNEKLTPPPMDILREVGFFFAVLGLVVRVFSNGKEAEDPFSCQRM